MNYCNPFFVMTFLLTGDEHFIAVHVLSKDGDNIRERLLRGCILAEGKEEFVCGVRNAKVYLFRLVGNHYQKK